MHTEGGGENGRLIFLLSIGDKRKILKLIFNTINCLTKHKKFVVLVLGKFRAGKDVLEGNF